MGVDDAAAADNVGVGKRLPGSKERGLRLVVAGQGIVAVILEGGRGLFERGNRAAFGAVGVNKGRRHAEHEAGYHAGQRPKEQLAHGDIGARKHHRTAADHDQEESARRRQAQGILGKAAHGSQCRGVQARQQQPPMAVARRKDEVAYQHAHGRDGNECGAGGEHNARAGAIRVALAKDDGERAGGNEQDGVVVAGQQRDGAGQENRQARAQRTGPAHRGAIKRGEQLGGAGALRDGIVKLGGHGAAGSFLGGVI